MLTSCTLARSVLERESVAAKRLAFTGHRDGLIAGLGPPNAVFRSYVAHKVMTIVAYSQSHDQFQTVLVDYYQASRFRDWGSLRAKLPNAVVGALLRETQTTGLPVSSATISLKGRPHAAAAAAGGWCGRPGRARTTPGPRSRQQERRQPRPERALASIAR